MGETRRRDGSVPLQVGDVGIYDAPGQSPPESGACPPWLLWVPPGAEPDEPAILRACEALAREPRWGALLDLGPDPEVPSLPLELATRPERLRCLLVRGEVWSNLRLPSEDRGLARAHLALRVAMSHDVGRASESLCRGGALETPSPVELGHYLAAAVRRFAAEDVYPGLRERDPEPGFVPALFDWTGRLLERQAYPEAFALGEYAASIGEGRNAGDGPRLGRPDPWPELGRDPLVSVILPTRDRPRLLARALACVDQQTCTDLEVIVVNDGGVDPGVVLGDLRERVGGGGRLTLVHHDRHRGPGAARNTGLRLARGRYVAFLDDDDRWLSHHIEALLPALRAGARAAHGDVRMVAESAPPGGALPCTQSTTVPYQQSYDRSLFGVDNQLPIHCLVSERDLLLEVGGFDERLTVLEDWDLWLRAFDRCTPEHVSRVTSEIRTREDGSRLTQRHEDDWVDALVRVYGKTLDREHLEPGLRARRLRYVLELCTERKVSFPAIAQVWLRGGAGLEPIDPAEWQARLDQGLQL